MEKIHVEFEHAVQSACEAVKDIELPDMEEIKLEMEEVAKEMEEIDHEKIRADMEKSVSEVNIDLDSLLYLCFFMFSSSDDLILQILSKIIKIIAVPCHPDDQVGIFFRFFLSIPECPG